MTPSATIASLARDMRAVVSLHKIMSDSMGSRMLVRHVAIDKDPELHRLMLCWQDATHGEVIDETGIAG